MFHSILACRLVLHLREVADRGTVRLDGATKLYDDSFSVDCPRRIAPIRFAPAQADSDASSRFTSQIGV
ncbi:hypothetical protein FA15DRAFT_675930 [Coprinopsis marcescibilis]|uniref:Uncharacterized protein n=1 Tax=Coprinopsis marcescibilis TaxID=230819 RepID=A0A5C3KC47_COPMA|nr:hypothetical protein FA15DRAFT_675930 [Coprinopsis marcescibilis]